MKISIRKVNFSDIEFLWYLRNQPDVYRYSKNVRQVAWQEHIDWLLPIILGQVAKELFIVQAGLLPAGYIRFDYQGEKEVKVSVAILKAFKGRGIAMEGFKKSIKILKKNPKIKIILAEVQKKNIVSQEFFEKLNFKLKEEKAGKIKYALNLKGQ